MILQRDIPIPIWGWAGRGERVSVEFDGKTYRGRTGGDGKWMLELSPMKAGGPYTMTISGKNRIVLHDILVGDVWLCSGQSNMVHQLKLHSVRYPEAIAGAHFPEIRQFWVPTLTDLQGPQGDLPAGHWASADPEDVPEFSAVAYFFARDLYEKYHVPQGIINASVGGTPIEAWISEEGLKEFPAIERAIVKNKDTAYINGMARSRAAEMAGLPRPVDKGLTGEPPWYSPAYVPKGWKPIGVPGYWEDQGVRGLDGVVWYRREIEVPEAMTRKAAKVFLGRIVNADALYINGKEVGNTTYEYPQRRYAVPDGLLKPGKNLFVVRVTNTGGKGGFVPDKPYCLIAGGDTVDLKGDWEYKVGEVFLPHATHGFAFSAQNAPTALYNAMIAPLEPFGLKGFLWYQGEANSNNAAEYARLQPAMIADWRRHWKEGELPFLYVQLPGFGDYNYLPAESGWAELREAQLGSLSVPRTGMAVAIDLGEWNDIHPDRKEPVGDRLALAAEKIAYGDSIVYSGPIYQSATFSGGRGTISFTHVGGGLMTNDDEAPQEFAIAGADKKFFWATAWIFGDKVIVWSDSVKEAKYVRYAWADDPVNPNLYNTGGLPASPFEAEFTPGTAARDTDHENMLRLLGITELRPGPSGDERAPNHANYDEGKANLCPVLPDVLTLKDGKKVTTAAMWWKQRRPEIVDGLEREVYGRVPAKVPTVRWSISDSGRRAVGSVAVIARDLIGHVDNSAFPSIDVNIKMVEVLPANAHGPVPVLMCFGSEAKAKEEELVKAGWGYVAIDPNSIQADNGPGLTSGIIGLVNKGQPRQPEDWGALRAWAWGAARGLDYLETDPAVDAHRVGIEGVSRYGKAALVTLAFEPRFAAGLIGSSGKGGATLLRRNYGEAVESLTGGEYYWMCGNFLRYGAAQGSFGSKTGCDLDVDSHELIALCAPRLTFISYGIPEKGDAHWLDHQGSYMATIAAGSVFKLLGAGDLGVSNDYIHEKMPPVNTGLLDGELAWRQHDGGHTDAPNMPYFIQWASTKFDDKGLKDFYADYFPIGVSVGPRDLSGDEARLILQQFNSLTPENAMKMGPIHPQENVYHWDDADSIVAFAQRHGLRVRGHNLCWHNQAPAWMFKDTNGDTVSKEQLLQRLKEHIMAVVSRYKGKLYAWDVVNEAIADDSAHYMRPSAWYRICGEEFIEKAFEYAHAADPSAVLFYNDYNTENPAKREKIYRLLKGLLAKGVPINGVGLQAHWSVNTPTREELERSIQLFSSLGLQVQFTELDISVYPGHQGGQLASGAGSAAVDSGFTADMEQKQLEKYKMVFEVFRKYKDKITGVTFWNVSDRHSWLDNRGRKNYPLLFDKELQPKKAWHAVTDWSEAAIPARTGHELWLGAGAAAPVTVVCAGSTPTLNIARDELRGGWQGAAGATVRLIVKKDKALRNDGFRLGENTIEANTDIGILYGAYALLRRQRTGESAAGGVSNPSYGLRLLDHWDNLNGSVERGYAGGSIFWRENDPYTVTDADKKLWREYARANASIGINGSVLNNVNASPKILTAEYIARAKAIADVLRPYGIKTYLSVNFASPVLLGGLKTADPLDAGVIAWWAAKVKEIYASIPDLGGLLVKASSEGQPGPQQYGRSHADGANMLADALKPYGGVMIWRAFVYAANDNDRAKQAYTEFMPLDGQFRDNVIIQVKNGPVDFQPREPFSPLFGALKKTSVAPEFQVTQEYLGHSVYVVFLSTMWEECLRSDTYQRGPGSTVSRCTDGSIYPQKYTLMAGVANIGTDGDWCGNLFAQANWYAFGRLAWNDTLSSERIADEWLKQTFSLKGAFDAVKQMMLDSREAAVNFMMPLGLHHIMSANGHYGPGPWWAPSGTRADWTPRYYHQASASGIGFDRTKKGSDAVDQYHEPLASEFNDVNTCPENYLLWFHHLPWDYKMKDGQRLWDALCHHWDTGVRQVRAFQACWEKAQPFVDHARFIAVQSKLSEECANAILWKDACIQYFQQFSGMPIPDGVDRPVHALDAIIAHEFDVRIP